MIMMFDDDDIGIDNDDDIDVNDDKIDISDDGNDESCLNFSVCRERPNQSSLAFKSSITKQVMHGVRMTTMSSESTQQRKELWHHRHAFAQSVAAT